MGVEIAWDKIDVGSTVDWCGTEVSVVDSTTVRAALPDKFTAELEHEAQELLRLPIVGLKRLRKFAGRSSWAAGVAPEVRGFLAPLWRVMGDTAKALASGSKIARLRGEPAVETSRIRTALV